MASPRVNRPPTISLKSPPQSPDFLQAPQLLLLPPQLHVVQPPVDASSMYGGPPLPYMTPLFQNQLPCHTLPRHAQDIQETEALAKLALELNSPVDITLQSTFERLVALAGSREFLPVASKVRHYLHSVALKRREWCLEYCVQPYIGPSGEGLFGKLQRDGMVCGGTFIVPGALLKGIDLEHVSIVEMLRNRCQNQSQNGTNSAAAVQASAHLDAQTAATPYPNTPISNASQHVTSSASNNHSATNNTQPLSQQNMINLCQEPRPCCSVDTAVFEALGLANSFSRPPSSDYVYDGTPPWIHSIYSPTPENSYYKLQRDAHLARLQEQQRIRFQIQQQRQLHHSMQFELYYQHQQQLYQQQLQQQHQGLVPQALAKNVPEFNHGSKRFNGPVSPQVGNKRVRGQPRHLSSQNSGNNGPQQESRQQSAGEDGLTRASSSSSMNSESLLNALEGGMAAARAAEK
ncbi:hypothetical protein BC830DRAFT_1168896 [Chytriomyces sp. MP71]|nr:hypothetical protein BC830DRAFT_1168896 [Chytriomyces sp. MP71]